jgi:ABC-type multidrug transport system ATPase subunit
VFLSRASVSPNLTPFSSRNHLWRNFGVVIAFTILYILITALAAESLSFVTSGGGALVFKRSKRTRANSKGAKKAESADEEKGTTVHGGTVAHGPSVSSGNGVQLREMTISDRIFTWHNVDYSVPYGNGFRKLLNNVSGYAKPGVMIALMGASGAGKTTLLNTLAQRQKVGIVSGEMLVDGRPLQEDFQRGTGFCEQMDLHDETATVREALEFSALLRQGRNIPNKEKIAYVNQIVDLLELEDIQDAIISSLRVEQKKRLTIGVELAAKPNLLLFLDEPTSGLDSQSALSIIRFLRRLSRAGQAIICTIHQPSSMLIQEFDKILALNPGGNTFYFGSIGQNGSAVVKYFADRGFFCPPSKNVAEFMLETAAKVSRRNGKRVDWNEEWRNSEEYVALMEEIEQIKVDRSKIPPEDIGTVHEYAAPIILQCVALTKRVFRQYWRDSSYLYGKLFVSVLIGVFNGFVGEIFANEEARPCALSSPLLTHRPDFLAARKFRVQHARSDVFYLPDYLDSADRHEQHCSQVLHESRPLGVS